MRRSGTRHLLSMADLDRDDIEQILNLTESFAEVGERLGIEEGSARVQFHRSLARLRGDRRIQDSR